MPVTEFATKLRNGVKGAALLAALGLPVMLVMIGFVRWPIVFASLLTALFAMLALVALFRGDRFRGSLLLIVTIGQALMTIDVAGVYTLSPWYIWLIAIPGLLIVGEDIVDES